MRTAPAPSRSVVSREEVVTERCPMAARLRSLVRIVALALCALAPAARGAGGVNVDFGAAFGVPSVGYGAASGQVGHWNMAGLGVTALADLSGTASGTSVNVVADFATGASGAPITDDELLLGDNFFSSPGVAWRAGFTGLADGAHLVFLYAPRHTSVPTGTMSVGGVPVAGIPGSGSSVLIEGTSWVKVPVTVTGGTLAISGSNTSYSGLAGLQLQPLPEPETYCTSGASTSGCNALISFTGYASATAPSGFTLDTTGVEGAKDGLYFFGSNGRQANTWGNGTSYQCVLPPVVRCGLLTAVGTPGLCDGAFSQDLNALWCATCPKPLKNPGAGATVQAQLWYRDPFNTSNQTTGMSNAIEFAVVP